jgi:hypothetical protein
VIVDQERDSERKVVAKDLIRFDPREANVQSRGLTGSDGDLWLTGFETALAFDGDSRRSEMSIDLARLIPARVRSEIGYVRDHDLVGMIASILHLERRFTEPSRRPPMQVAHSARQSRDPQSLLHGFRGRILDASDCGIVVFGSDRATWAGPRARDSLIGTAPACPRKGNDDCQ